MSNITAEDIETLKHADPTPGVHETILRRWSPRAFTDRPVNAADMKKLFEAARWAASSFNEQPWRFIVGRKGDATYEKIFESLVPLNQAWANTAPVLMLSVGKKPSLKVENRIITRCTILALPQRTWRCRQLPWGSISTPWEGLIAKKYARPSEFPRITKSAR